MRSLIQLLRRPVKYLFGLVLMSLAAAIGCICVGQALAARTTGERLDHQFTTVALPAGSAEFDALRIQVVNVALSKEVETWLEEMTQSHPDVVKEISRQGMLSAYVPELTPMNYTQGPYIADNFSADKPFWHYQPEPDGLPYSCAMLVVTLDEISEPEAQERSFTIEKPREIRDFPSVSAYLEWYNAAEKQTVITGYTVNLTGTVTEVVSLQEGYRDPTGMIARLSITVPTLEEVEALGLETGGRYLVYGMNYYDQDWALREYLADERHSNPVEIEEFDLKKLHWLTEEELSYYAGTSPSLIPAARYGSLMLTQRQCDQIHAVSMSLQLPVPLIVYEDVRDKDGKLLELRVQEQVTWDTPDGQTGTMENGEYAALYETPTIARLESSVDGFLSSPEGALWQQALERDRINNHAFAVIGVDTMGHLADFAREDARITQGRDFTARELENGARVCILHEALAASNGLTVGDTITLNLYQGDPALPYQEFRHENRGILTPAADFYFDTIDFQETAEYTIVGLYRGQTLWVDVSVNEYGFSPNTVFVPKSSVETPMEYPDSILFTTPVLRNGKIEAFRTLAAQEGYLERFVYYDQGYSTIAGNFHNYDALAKQVLTIGSAVYLVLLLLFLLLYPGAEGKTVRTMRSLGAPFGKRMGHVMISAMGILVPASVLGCLLGLGLWQNVVDALKTSAESAMTLQIEMETLVLVSAVEFGLALVLSLGAACLVAAPRGMSSGR